MYYPFTCVKSDSGMVLHTVCEHRGTDTTRMVYTLENLTQSVLCGMDFQLCFTVVRDLIPERMHGASLNYKEGSHHVVTPPADLILNPNDTWVFSSENTRLALQHVSDAPQSVYIKHHTKSPVTYTDVYSTAIVFTDKDELDFTQDTIPQSNPDVNVPPLVPVPNAYSRTSGDACSLVQGLKFICTDNAVAEQSVQSAKKVSQSLFCAFDMLAETPNGTPVYFTHDKDLNDEAYTLSIKSDAVYISAKSGSGYFYALISLLQLVHANTENTPLDITDTPRFSYRGQHLDVVRQFYTVDEIKRLLDVMALHKVNTFHWHLTDDESWRLEIKAFPELTQQLAYRGEGQIVPPVFGSGYRPYGGYYSQADVKEIIAYATERHIAVIPEIDVPGHCFGVVRLSPELQEPTDTSQYISVQNYSQNTLNPALPATYDFIDTVMGEVAELFPDPRIHIGADERPSGAWRESSACKALMESQNIDDFNGLQTYFIKRVHDIVRKYGKTMGAWEEASEDGTIDNDCYIVSWRGIVAGLNAAHKGHVVVMSPAQYLYWDMAQTHHQFDPGLSWAGHCDLSDTYNYEPLTIDDANAMDGKDLGEVSQDDLNHIIGIQGCIWSENIHNKDLLYFMVMPRLSAMAEVAWSTAQHKNYDRFLYTLNTYFLPLMDKAGISYRPFDYIRQCLDYKRTNNLKG